MLFDLLIQCNSIIMKKYLNQDSVKNAILKSIPFAEKDVVSQIEEVMYKIEKISLGKEN